MSHAITHKSAIILLVGAGPTNTNMILSAAAHASSFIAADGGFKAATDAGLDVTLVIGDMDSQSEPLRSQNVLKMTAQDTTDFEKCLQVCDAEVFLGVGFLGGRLDHQMAAFSALLRDKRVVILMDDDQYIAFTPTCH
jgi:thiamine pyrophosphokinase